MVLPPADTTAALAQWADAEVRATFAVTAGLDACDAEWMTGAGAWRWDRIALPARLGGCGLPSAARTAAHAYYGTFFANAPLVMEREERYMQHRTPAGALTSLFAAPA